MSIASHLESVWFNTTSGQYLLEKEQALYDQAVFDLFGFNALQMGDLQMDLLRNSRIPNRFQSADVASTAFKHHLSCCDDFLPFADMSLDLLLLPHRLEFSERPHQTLREAARVMMPEGHLLISGFNPMSSWGAAARIKQWFSNNQTYPWNGDFIRLARLRDWLALLGFEVVSIQKCCHIPPFEQASWHRRLSFLDKMGERCGPRFGGIYFIVAKKRVVGMTAIKPNWKANPLSSALIARQPKSNTSQFCAGAILSNATPSKHKQKNDG